MASLVLKIDGMTCGHCVRAVTLALQAVEGVAAVDVRLDTGEAAVTGSAESADLIRAVGDAGYAATVAAAG